MSAGAAAHSESQRALGRAEEYRRKAQWHEQRAANYDKGEQGELLVAQALARLVPAGFAVINDVRWPGRPKANIDHIVYGPSGMYVVDAKNWSGNVVIKNGVLRCSGYGKRSDTEKVATMAAALQTQLAPSAGAVRAVVCMAGQHELRGAWCGDTYVVGLNGLGAWLFRQPQIWPEHHVHALSDWLPYALQPADAASGPVTVARLWPSAPYIAAHAATPTPPLAQSRVQSPEAGTRPGGIFGWMKRR